MTYAMYVTYMEKVRSMPGNWDQVHRRHRIVRGIVTRTPDSAAPLSDADLDAIGTEYGEFVDFLLDVHSLWARTFVARLDDVLERSPSDLAAALERICAEVAQALPGARRILDAYSDEPAVAAAAARLERQVVDAIGVEPSRPMVEAPRAPMRANACAVRRRFRAVRMAYAR